MKSEYNTAIIITVISIALLIFITKLIRTIIQPHFNDTTTTTSPPPEFIQSPPPPTIHHHHSLRFLFNSQQISPQPGINLQSYNQRLIHSLPTFQFQSITGIRNSSSSSETTKPALDCAICISRFEKQDELRLLPSCCHVFHSVCIDKWILMLNHTCPICRSDVRFVEDDDDELKMVSSSRSFRVEIGSVSLSRRIDESFAASDLQNHRSNYSLGSFEYWIQEFDAEVYVDLERINDEISVSVAGGGVGDEPTEMVVEENRAEFDEFTSDARSHSYAFNFSDRLFGGSERRSGGGIDEDGGGGSGRIWDLEGNTFGEDISEAFGFLSRV